MIHRYVPKAKRKAVSQRMLAAKKAKRRRLAACGRQRARRTGSAPIVKVSRPSEKQ